MARYLLSTVLGMAVFAAGVVAVSQDKKPVNAKCPIKGTAAKADITSDYQGKTIGFC